MKKSVGITVLGGLAAAAVLGTGVVIMKSRPGTVESGQRTDTAADAGEIVEASAAVTEAEPRTVDMKEAASSTPKDTQSKEEASQQAAGTKDAEGNQEQENKELQQEEPTVKDGTEKAEAAASGNAEKTGDGEDMAASGTEAEDDGVSIQNEEVNSYLADSVIIGDSIVLGYRNYCRKSEDKALHEINFLAAGSFSAHNALWPVSEKSVHPVYQGKQRPIWESISMMGVKNIFLCFGLNDLNIDDKTIECYREVIDHIIEGSPDVQIHIISMTYTLKDQGIGKLNNDEIRVYNTKLQEMAEENGWGYVDMATALEDEEGNLTAEFCSDGFLHQNPLAYDVWTEVLRGYVAKWLNIAESAEEPETAPDTSADVS